MNGVNILIVSVALFGFLPLVIFLYKKKRANRILTTGLPARAIVYYITKSIKSHTEIVYYYFIASNGKQYKGRLTVRPGLHKMNEEIEVFYLPDNPKHNTVKGAWNSNFFLVFVIIIALAVVFMMYKLHEMVEAGTL